MLVSMSEVLDASVGALLGETVSEPEADNLSAIAEKLQVVDLQLARGRKLWRRLVRGTLLALAIATALVFATVSSFTDDELCVLVKFRSCAPPLGRVSWSPVTRTWLSW